MRSRLLLCALIIATACTLHKPPPPPGPPAPRTVLVIVSDAVKGTRVAGAIVTVISGTGAKFFGEPTNGSGETRVLNVEGALRQYTLDVQAEQYFAFNQSKDLGAGEQTVTVQLAPRPPPPPVGPCVDAAGVRGPYPFPAEAGKLHVDGRFFKTDTGAVWDWRGADAYLTFALFLRGDVDGTKAKLNEARCDGANVVRIFGQVNWAGQEDYQHPNARPDFGEKARAFVTLVEEYGLRLEYTVLTFPDSTPAMRAYLQQAYELLASRSIGHFLEIGNECDPQGINCEAAAAGVDRHGVLSAYGYYAPSDRMAAGLEYRNPTVFDCSVEHWFLNGTAIAGPPVSTLRMLDYLTVHTDRGPEWVRKAKDGEELESGYGDQCLREWFGGARRPTIGDEPMGAAERDEGGRRGTVPSDFAAHLGIARLLTAGATWHSQAGLEGRARTPAETVQTAIAAAVLDVWRHIPATAQTLNYTAGHLDIGVNWREGDAMRAYGAKSDAVQYVIIARPAAGYVVTPKAGWAITESAAPFYKLERR